MIFYIRLPCIGCSGLQFPNVGNARFRRFDAGCGNCRIGILITVMRYEYARYWAQWYPDNMTDYDNLLAEVQCNLCGIYWHSFLCFVISLFCRRIKLLLPFEYYVVVWQVSLQLSRLSCGDTSEIWMWLKKKLIPAFINSEITLTNELEKAVFVPPTKKCDSIAGLKLFNF